MARVLRRRLRYERAARKIEIKFRPLRARKRPFLLHALLEAVEMAHLQPHARLAVPAILFAFQKVVEETFLYFAAVVGIEMGPVFDPVDFEPLLCRSGAHKTLEIAARMQSLAAPIRGG